MTGQNADDMMPRATLQEMHQEEIRSVFDRLNSTLSQAYRPKGVQRRRERELEIEAQRFKRHHYNEQTG